MGTKMKGVLKGLRYITQIFEDEKEPEIQIGFPTDVKHVAHIGWDGPSVDNSPSWMKEYKASEKPQTTKDEGKENPNLTCCSQDSSCQRGSRPQTNPTRDLPDLPKPSRHPSLSDGSSTSSPKGSKSRQSRRKSSDSSKSTRKQKDPGSESPSRILLGLPKRSSQKKTKEKESSKEESSKSRTKDVSPCDSCSSLSEPGMGTESTNGYDSNKFVHSSSLRSSVKKEDKG